MAKLTVTDRNIEKDASTEGGKYSSAGKSQWEGNSLWECLLFYGLIQGSSNHFIIASLLNRRLSCWHLSICSCLDHLPSPFATALHSRDILEEQCLVSNLFYFTLWQFIRLKEGEGPAPHGSQLVMQELIFMNEAENSGCCNSFDISAQTDHSPMTVLPRPCGTLPTSAVTAYGQPLWARYLGTY